MIDIKTMIESNENFCKHLGWTPAPVKDAIKVMKMWRAFKSEYGGLIIKFPSHSEDVSEYMDEIEERFFPSTVTSGYKIKIEGKTIEEVERTANFIKNNVEGVTEVRMHDKDC